MATAWAAFDAIPEDSDSLTSEEEEDDREELDDAAEDDEPAEPEDEAEDWRGFSCCIAAGFSSVMQ